MMQFREDAPAEVPKGALNLASPILGAEAILANDEFFGAKERLIRDAAPVFHPDKYDDHGKWMDGWETRRRRDGGTHDFCVVRLGARGRIALVDIDTRFFTGNFPPRATLEAALCDGRPDESTAWTEIVASTPLSGNAHNLVAVSAEGLFNHVRLSIFPDGGVARLRVYGFPAGGWDRADTETVHELSSAASGGRVVGYSDAHYGNPWVILAPNRGANMGDGWETRRRRVPGNDWIVIALGGAGRIDRLEVDTAHFKGNYPDRCSVQAARCPGIADDEAVAASQDWAEVLAPSKLQMDRVHLFEGPQVACPGPVTHVRLNIYPDGGISRFRVFGRLSAED
ncbi:MAG: allantoicase [Rhodospirillaceae bacterium]